MNLPVLVALIVSIVTLFGSTTTVILFFGKLKWDNARQDTDLEKIRIDLNALGQKINQLADDEHQEMKTVLVKVDAVDKAVIGLAATVGYIKETLTDLREKLYKNNAII